MRMKSARVHRPLLPFPLPPPPPITPAFASSGIPKQQPSTTISAASSAQSILQAVQLKQVAKRQQLKTWV
jgi:hypothetical protein